MMSLPNVEDYELHSRLPIRKKIRFANPDWGLPHDQELAKQHLVVGVEYETSKVVVNQSSSQVELSQFPNVWFNTVLFNDVES